MAELYDDVEVVGSIAPLENGTRLRVEPSTYVTVRANYNVGAVVEIDLVRTYTESTIRPAVWVGDKWGRVRKVNGVPVIQPSWMAIDYHGQPVCSKKYTIVGEEPVPVDPYPEAFLISPIVGGVTLPAKEYKLVDANDL